MKFKILFCGFNLATAKVEEHEVALITHVVSYKGEMIKYSEKKSGNQIFGVKLSPTRVVGGEAHTSDAI